MGPILGRQDPGGPHVGPMKFAIWVGFHAISNSVNGLAPVGHRPSAAVLLNCVELVTSQLNQNTVGTLLGRNIGVIVALGEPWVDSGNGLDWTDQIIPE